MKKDGYYEGFQDGYRAGLTKVSLYMYMVIDENKCTNCQYHNGFESGFRRGLEKHGLKPIISERKKCLPYVKDYNPTMK